MEPEGLAGELAGVAVGSLGHILRKTFKELYVPREPPQDEEAAPLVPDGFGNVDNSAEGDDEALVEGSDGGNGDDAGSDAAEDGAEGDVDATDGAADEGDGEAVDGDEQEGSEEQTGALPADTEVEGDTLVAEEQPETTSDPGDAGAAAFVLEVANADTEGVDREEGLEELRKIDASLSMAVRQAVEIEAYLEAQRVAAVEEDDAEASRLYDQGLLAKAEYPCGRSNLNLDSNTVGTFGVFGSSLILARQLMQDNEATAMYRRGQGPSRGLDKAYQLRASTPNYLKSTHTQEVRLEMNREKQERTRAARARTSSAGLLDGSDFSTKKRSRRKADKNPSVGDIEANEKVLRRMRNTQQFLVNPRFRDQRSQRKKWKVSLENVDGSEPAEQQLVPSVQDAFHCVPSKAQYTSYVVGGTYTCTLKLKNVSGVSRRVRVLPPTTPYFSISLLKYPSETGTVAPGMATHVDVRFCPDSLADYSDFITVQTETGNFRIPLDAHRPPPSLTIPLDLDCGCCLVGNRTLVTFHCANYGGSGRFRLLPASEWPNPSSTHYDYDSIDIAPFRISPAEFSLNRGESVDLKISFFPEGTGEAKHSREFVMVCDNCQVKTFTVRGTSCQVKLDISAIDHAVVDLAAAHVKPAECLLFGTTTPGAIVKREVRVQNCTPIELPFHWSIFEEVEKEPKLPKQQQSQEGLQLPSTGAGVAALAVAALPVTRGGPASAGEIKPAKRFSLVPVSKVKGASGIFSVSPAKGSFPPGASMVFTVDFAPTRSIDYRQAMRLVIESVPPASVEGFKLRRRRTTQNLRRGSRSAADVALLVEGGQPTVEKMPAVTEGLPLVGSEMVSRGGGSAGAGGGTSRVPDSARFSEYSGISNDTSSQLGTARSLLSSAGEHNNNEEGDLAQVLLVNIPVMKLKLRGAAKEAELVVHPTVIHLAGELLPGRTYTRKLSLENKSAASCNFVYQGAVAREWGGKQPPDFVLSVVPESGTLAPGELTDAVLEFTPRCVGDFSVDVVLTSPNGPMKGSVTRVQATVVGPSVRFEEPEIDFGLVGVGESVQYEIPYVNLSDTPAQYRFCVAGAPEEPWPSEIEAAESQTRQLEDRTEEAPDDVEESVVGPMPSPSRDGASGSQSRQKAATHDKCVLRFLPSQGVLPPLGRAVVRVTCEAGRKPERLREVLECRVRDAGSQFTRVRGEVQSPKVFIDVSQIDLGVTYVTVSAKRTIRITNISNLPAHFAWSEIGGNAAYYDATFSEMRGTLHAKQTKELTFTYTARKSSSRIETLFVCDVEGMLAPLGFTFKTVSRGLVVTYSIVPPGITADMMRLEPPKQVKDGPTKTKNSTAGAKIPICDFGDDVQLTKRRTSVTHARNDLSLACLLRSLFRNVTGLIFVNVNARVTLYRLRLCLVNHSAIPTTFAISVRDCPAHVLPASLGGKAPPPASSTLQSKLPASSVALVPSRASRTSLLLGSKSSQEGNNALRRLGDRHERTDIYASKAGSEHINRRLQAQEDRDVLGEGKEGGGRGVAFLAVQSKGSLAPWSAVIVDVVCFNNMPGRYKDELICEVEGLPQTRIPVKAKVVGSPLELSTNTVGLNVRAKPWSELRWGDVVHSMPKVTKILRVVNNGPVDARLKWHVKAKRPLDADLVETAFALRELGGAGPGGDLVEENAEDPVHVSIVPHREIALPPPFLVWPRQRTIPAHGSASFQVTFEPTELTGVSKAVMVADGEWLYSKEEGTISESPSATDISSVASMAPSASPVPSDSGSEALAARDRALSSISSTSLRMAAKLVNKARAERDPMKKCLRLALSASTIEAELKLDRATRFEDGMQYLEFMVSATKPLDHKSYFKSLYLSNKTAALLPCFIQASPPFSVYSTTTCAPAHSPTPSEIARLVPPDVDAEGSARKHIFALPSGDDLSINVRFKPTRQSGELDINQRLKAVHRGTLTVFYANSTRQVINLEAVVTMPTVVVRPSAHDFLTVHTETFARTILSVSNPTVDGARWNIAHVPGTEQDEIDDVSCWTFDPPSGFVGPNTLPLESTNSFAPQGAQKKGVRPTSVTVKFAPRRRGPHKSRFHFVVENGAGFDVLLQGEGTFEEPDDMLVLGVPRPAQRFEIFDG